MPRAAAHRGDARRPSTARPRRWDWRAGDVLVFEEVVRPDTGLAPDADPTHRHAVRLDRDPTEVVDRLTAPPRPRGLVVRRRRASVRPVCAGRPRPGRDPAPGQRRAGNVVLVDHGRTITGSGDAPGLTPSVVPDRGRYRPVLTEPELTQRIPYDAAAARRASASTALPGPARGQPRDRARRRRRTVVPGARPPLDRPLRPEVRRRAGERRPRDGPLRRRRPRSSAGGRDVDGRDVSRRHRFGGQRRPRCDRTRRRGSGHRAGRHRPRLEPAPRHRWHRPGAARAGAAVRRPGVPDAGTRRDRGGLRCRRRAAPRGPDGRPRLAAGPGAGTRCS